MAGVVEISEQWKELVRSLGTEQLVNAIYVAMDDFQARDGDTIPPKLWSQIGERCAAYKNPFVRDGSGSGSSAGEVVERIKSKLEVREEGGGRPGSDSSEDAVVELLRELQSVPMTFQTLEATNIGKTISGLRKHSSEQVRDLATALYKNWKALVNEHLSSSKPPVPNKTASAPAADHVNVNAAASTKPAREAVTKTPRNKRKEAPPEMEEAKLEAARKKPKGRYRDAKKGDKIQMVNAPGKAKQRPGVAVRQSRAPVRSSLRA
uniref:TFIIS N-terminal domain-containing protein n=1 Tax=Oryza brachyantha TaxID=4533 RepID=J3N1C1_ORYBR